MYICVYIHIYIYIYIYVYMYIYIYILFDPESLPSKYLTRLPGVCSGGGQVIFQRL